MIAATATIKADRMARWRAVKRLLCVRLDNLGDVLMTTPALRALKRMPPPLNARSARPRQLTLLTSKSGAEIAAHIPEVDEVIRYDAPWMKASSSHEPMEDRALIDRLAEAAFDAAVIFTCYSQSALPAALLCSYAGIPLKLAHSRENPYALLSDWAQESEPDKRVRHEVQRQLDLVATVGARTVQQQLSLRVDRTDVIGTARKLTALLGRAPAQQSYLVVHPGATAPSRRYAPERFAVVARELSQHLRVPILLTGSQAERPLVEDIVRGCGAAAWNLAGELTVGELAALIRGAGILVSNNSGPVHIACAVGTPVVDLYALTNPQHTPWQVPHRVLNRDVPCRDCYKSICPEGHGACLDVSAAEVAAAGRALWRERAAERTLIGAGERTRISRSLLC